MISTSGQAVDPTCRVSRRRPSAFTLIELLVVIAIIALLMSILVPTLKQAKVLAVRTVCASRARAILTGSFSYASENREFFPYRKPGSYLPHTIACSLFDLRETFVKKYVPSPVKRQIIEAGKTYDVLDPDAAMYCPGPLREARGPEVPGWNTTGGYAYTYSSYQYINFDPGWGLTYVNSGKMPNLRHSQAEGRYPLWTCLTVDKSYSFLAHDVPERARTPLGMTAAFISGATAWIDWSQCQRYWNDGGQDFYWPDPFRQQ